MTLADRHVLEADVLLVAVGRGPVTEGLGYERGRRHVGPWVRVGRRTTSDLGARGLRRRRPGSAGCSWRTVASRTGSSSPSRSRTGWAATSRCPAPVADRELPRVTYCDPEIASVGLSEAAAREEYGEVETLTYDLAGNGKSQILKTAGFVKLIRRAGGPVVGVHLVGSRVSELVWEAQLITGWDAYPGRRGRVSSHAHPTQSEALGEAHLALAGKPLHAHA